ncbi:hypothetical protein Krac_5575 [Ktedonobacter racemifer DSM 44963]|uniref:Uncharacterized protein n=1 Tax=Ktedonobacter racemifer DSM 44963 TaxID=485913 RepID=D6TWC8_KTERA|nr:hypothetical protein Krac_5575 [Ktedonobacter racemifer DSM 44963]
MVPIVVDNWDHHRLLHLISSISYHLILPVTLRIGKSRAASDTVP